MNALHDGVVGKISSNYGVILYMVPVLSDGLNNLWGGFTESCSKNWSVGVVFLACIFILKSVIVSNRIDKVLLGGGRVT